MTLSSKNKSQFQMLVVSITALVAVACSSSSPKPMKVAFAPGTTQVSEVTVINEGSEPKTALRYQVAPGLSEIIKVQLALGMYASGEQQGVEVVGLPTDLSVAVGPTEKLKNGDIRYRLAITDVKAHYPKNASRAYMETVEAEIAPLREIHGILEMNDRGLLQAFDFKYPLNVSPRTLTLLGNVRSWLINIPFPSEKVGMGAQWLAKRKVDLNGVMVDQEVRYRLVAMKGSQIELDVVARQSGARQSYEDQTGATATLSALESLGTGTVKLDLTRLATSSDADVSTQMRLTIKSSDQTMPIKARIETAIQTEGSKDIAAAKSAK